MHAYEYIRSSEVLRDVQSTHVDIGYPFDRSEYWSDPLHIGLPDRQMVAVLYVV